MLPLTRANPANRAKPDAHESGGCSPRIGCGRRVPSTLSFTRRYSRCHRSCSARSAMARALFWNSSNSRRPASSSGSESSSLLMTLSLPFGGGCGFGPRLVLGAPSARAASCRAASGGIGPERFGLGELGRNDALDDALPSSSKINLRSRARGAVGPSSFAILAAVLLMRAFSDMERIKSAFCRLRQCGFIVRLSRRADIPLAPFIRSSPGSTACRATGAAAAGSDGRVSFLLGNFDASV
jgi:hypothetical protein